MRNDHEEEKEKSSKFQSFGTGLLCGLFAGGLITFGILPPTIEVSTKQDAWDVMICPKEEVGCKRGGIQFPSQEECEKFVSAAAVSQPSVGRSCHQVLDRWRIE